MTKSFLLPTLNACTGAVITGQSIILAGSAEQALYVCDFFSGAITEIIPTNNAYYSFAADGDGFAALSGKREVFYLSKSFAEIGSVRMPADAAGIATTPAGQIVLSTENGIFLCERDGSVMSKLNDKNAASYAVSASAKACAYFVNEKINVDVSCPTADFTYTVPHFLTLRSLVPYGADIYGLFGYKYKYNCLLPILSGGLNATEKYKTVKDLLTLLRQN